MPDLRTVLTETQRAEIRDAISAHRLWNGRCEACGAVSRRESDHMADVVIETLAGLPGVAVTQLPDADHVQPGDEFENGRTDYALGDVSVFEDGEIHLFGAVWQLSDVKTLAAALLAAALSVEGNTNA